MTAPFYRPIGPEFIRLTQGQPFETKGAFAIVLDLMVDYRGSIPDDARYVAGVLGVSVRRWGVIRAALLRATLLAAREGRLWAAPSQKFAPAGEAVAGASGQSRKRKDKAGISSGKSRDNFHEKQLDTNSINDLPGATSSTGGKVQGQVQETPPLPPSGGKDGGALALPDFLDRQAEGAEFDQFWLAWRPEPHASRPKALAAWRATANRRPALPLLLACVAAYLAHHAADTDARKKSKPARAPINRYSAEHWLTDERWAGFLDDARSARDVPVNNNFNGHGAALADAIGIGPYRSYFADAHYDEGENVVVVSSDFRRQQITERYHAALCDVFGATVRVEFRQ